MQKKKETKMDQYSKHSTVESSMDNMPQPEIVIPDLIFQKIMHWVVLAGSQECSGLGSTKIVDGRIHIVDVVMIKQKNNFASTDLDAEEVAKAMYKLRDSEGNLNFWWHSHANMQVFWSGTDKDTIAQIGRQGMCVAAVFNTRREVRAAVACMSPIPFFIDNVKLKLESSISQELITAWDEEYNSNVQKFGYSHGYTNRRWQEEWPEDNIALPGTSVPPANPPEVVDYSKIGNERFNDDGSPDEDDYDWESDLIQFMDVKEIQDYLDNSDFDSVTGEYVMRDGTRITETMYDKLTARESILRRTQNAI